MLLLVLVVLVVVVVIVVALQFVCVYKYNVSGARSLVRVFVCDRDRFVNLIILVDLSEIFHWLTLTAQSHC